MLIAALLAATLASPSPSPSLPASSDPPDVQVEAGWNNDQLTGNRVPWNEQYLNAIVKEGNGLTYYGNISQNERFSRHDTRYEAAVYLPTDTRHSNLMVDAAFSPQHDVLPASEIEGAYDLRAGGGYGYDGGFDERNYANTNVSIYTAGADRYFGVNQLAYVASFAALKGSPGVAFSQTMRWSVFEGADRFSVAASAGRDVENTGVGNNVAVFRTFVLDGDALHWFNSQTALHFGIGYDGLYPHAYDRFEVRLGLREHF
jgi:YaiO family outer membrane protein